MVNAAQNCGDCRVAKFRRKQIYGIEQGAGSEGFAGGSVRYPLVCLSLAIFNAKCNGTHYSNSKRTRQKAGKT